MNRTAITLAILSVFFIVVQALAIAGRCYHRIISNKYAAKDLKIGAVGWSWDDYLICFAYVLAIINWSVFIWAGFEGLGTNNVTAHADLVQNLVLAIQALSIIANFLAKSSFALLLTRIAASMRRIDIISKSLAGLVAVLGLVAALVVIIPCWPGANDATCLADSYRWIFLTVLDVTSEIGMVGFIAYTLRNIQFRETHQKWKLGAVITLGRCCTIPLAISFCVVMLRSSGIPYLGHQILDALERQQGLLFASLFTSTLIPVFNLFNITKIEVVDSSVELNITKTIEVRMENDGQKHKVNSSAASLAGSTHGDTRELLNPQEYRHGAWRGYGKEAV